MPIRVASIAPWNGDPPSAPAASIASRTKMTSCGRSRKAANWFCGVPHDGKSKIVLPGCGGATTTKPYEARRAVRKMLWFGNPHDPWENMRIGYGTADPSTGASTTAPQRQPAPSGAVAQPPVPPVQYVAKEVLVNVTTRTPGTNGPSCRTSKQ